MIAEYKNEIVAKVDLLMKKEPNVEQNSPDSLKPGTVTVAEENNSEKWVITSSGLKGATGTLSVELPADVPWNVYIATTEDKGLLTTYNTKSHSLLPGQFNILLTKLPVNGVPVQKGMNTRLKGGILNVVTTGQWSIHDERKQKCMLSITNPVK